MLSGFIEFSIRYNMLSNEIFILEAHILNSKWQHQEWGQQVPMATDKGCVHGSLTRLIVAHTPGLAG